MSCPCLLQGKTSSTSTICQLPSLHSLTWYTPSGQNSLVRIIFLIRSGCSAKTARELKNLRNKVISIVNNFPSKYIIQHVSWLRMQTQELSLCMRKPTICICENKDADQLRGNREADQRLCFRYTDSICPLLLISEISSF